ncbi:MAG: hypothetical protein JO019_03905 [Candidatus Kaiserbacteria bacterium]|nr:hypothetical protein [Candidatus Kaiserbacteria bacterium]
MIRWITTTLAAAAFALTIGFGTTTVQAHEHSAAPVLSDMGKAPLITPAMKEHVGHTALSIPASWSDAEVAAFVKQSDAKIDSWAGRTVAPGETIIHDGLPFTKSPASWTIAQRRSGCKWCPLKKACH